jgi:hypothetical protein
MDVTVPIAVVAAILGIRFAFAKRVRVYTADHYDPIQAVTVAKKVEMPRPPYTQNIINHHLPSPDQNAKNVTSKGQHLLADKAYQERYQRLVNLTVNGTEHPLLDPANIWTPQVKKGTNVVNML